jgi:hypothetical protein
MSLFGTVALIQRINPCSVKGTGTSKERRERGHEEIYHQIAGASKGVAGYRGAAS